MYDEPDLIKLTSTSPENETYMNQMQYALNIDFVFDDSSEICLYCLEDLNKVYQFRKKFDVAVEYWKIYDSKQNSRNASISDIKLENDDSEGEGSCMDSMKKEEIEFVATFACGRCQLMFNSAAKLVSHQCTKPNNPVKQKIPQAKVQPVKQPIEVFCKICESTFDQQWKLNRHMTKEHRANKYNCADCGRNFSNSLNLREHEAAHTGTMNYNCEICGKLFLRLSSQKRHLMSHQGKKPKKKPFLCNICGKSFPFSNGMQRHMRTHTGDRRHMCKICGKRFMTSTHLKVHLRTHTGEKPYGCHVCHSWFTLPATLRKHLKVHEREGICFVEGESNVEQSEDLFQQNDEDDEAVQALVTFS
ncbi:unnamed protein product [Phaedon cochleariae]|uniref:C2H2-type domain-containing protein n=1 Tax=Phaedon cochleariae TaxID=80249 RepID=A0A9N9X808_PHACE|nr:unnamed protein product [Phaedon cochleariae]